MTWAYRNKTDDDVYTMKWTYAAENYGDYAADMLHAGCDIDMHNFNIYNAKISEGSVKFNLPGITDIFEAGGIRWNFQKGRLVDAAVV